jgi:transcriptional regulator with XRE-family HTH domain
MGLALGQYVKFARKEAKLSALALSKTVGISKSYLDYIESGAREPKPDVLARIGAALEIPITALIEQQQKDLLGSAIIKLKGENATEDGEELRSIARSTNEKMTIDERALAMTQAAFEGVSDDAKYAEYVSNPELRAILKVGARLSNEDLVKIRKIMESLYPNEFIQL